MDVSKHNREVVLLCPACGCTEFACEQGDSESVEILTCASCGRQMTKEALIEENGENITAHVDEIGKAAVKDAAEEVRNMLRRAFSGNRNITFK
jgi:uncharacterized Zn finger protein (UPF0148 family)